MSMALILIHKFSKLLLNIKKSRDKIKDHYLLEKYRRKYLKNLPPKILDDSVQSSTSSVLIFLSSTIIIIE